MSPSITTSANSCTWNEAASVSRMDLMRRPPNMAAASYADSAACIVRHKVPARAV